MIEENKNTETNNQQVEENSLYYYFGSDGTKYHTGSQTFAHARAEYYETLKVYREKQ